MSKAKNEILVLNVHQAIYNVKVVYTTILDGTPVLNEKDLLVVGNTTQQAIKLAMMSDNLPDPIKSVHIEGMTDVFSVITE